MARCVHNTHRLQRLAKSAFVIEMLFRLGIALLLSVSLALLLAWGWDRSDTLTAQPSVGIGAPGAPGGPTPPLR